VAESPLAGLTWPAPAKVNRFLHIVGRRPDGYHRLQTLFQFLDLCDGLGFRHRADHRVRLHGGCPDVAPSDDLCVRAAHALRRAAGVNHGVDIHLSKRIPTGGGLGGGSSDAATVLVALNLLWDLNWNRRRLAAVGLELGADVPVFVHGRSAWAQGVGEELTPVQPDLPVFLVAVPPVHVSTAEVFNDPDLTRDSPILKISARLEAVAGNDCEGVVRRRYPEVERAFELLEPYGQPRLTGTGACVFLACGSREQALRAQRGIGSQMRCFVAGGLNVSPLRALVDGLTGGTV
jgi:4-diphosphocytidyl-2-C-methyl-D-erythritol kinase